MKILSRFLAGGLASILALSACSAADTDVEGAVDDATATIVDEAENITDTTLGADTAETVAKLQTSLDVVSTELEDASANADLMAAWDEIQARVSTAILSVESNTEFDVAAVEDSLDSFESTLASSDVEAEIGTAWDDFRVTLQSFIESFATAG